MSKELHIALQEAIGDFGTDVLKSPFLVNILQDYGAFDIHDKDISLKKEIISTLVASGYGDKLTRWKKESDWESENNKYISRIKKKQSFDEEKLYEISNAFIRATGLRAKATPQESQKNIQNTQQSHKQNTVTSYITKAKKHIPHFIDKNKLFRIILYIISVWNVIQLLAAVERVTTWGVWDGIIILPLIGVLGVLLGLLLPVLGLSVLFYAIEESKRVNFKKTNIAIITSNLIGIYGLYAMSKLHLWSWHHIWLILRPFVYVLGAIAAIGITILILIGIYWLLVKIGRAIIRFFTT